MSIHFLANFFASFSSRFSLRTVLSVPFVIQMVTIIGLVGYLSVRSGQQVVNDIASQLCQEISDRTSERIRTYFKTPHQINLSNANAIALGELDIKNAKALERHFLKQVQLFNSIERIYFSNSQGGLISVGSDERGLSVAFTENFVRSTLYVYGVNSQGNRKDLLLKQPKYDARERPFYQSAVKSRKPIWSPIYIYIPESRGLGIAASYPFYDDRGKLQGVLSSDLSLLAIDQFLQQLKIGIHGKAFIIERSGLMVASSIPERPFFQNTTGINRIKATDSKEPLIRLSTQHLFSHLGTLTQINTSTQLNFKLNGKKHFLQVTPFKDELGLDWLIVIVVPETDFTTPISTNTRNTIVLCLAALVISTIIASLTARWITQPILRLNTAAKKMAQGDWDCTVEIKRADEVGQLTKSFNHMATQLAGYSRTLEAQIACRTEALQQSEERFRKAFETTAVGMCLVSLEGRFLEVNHSVCQILGYSELELLSLSWQEITDPEDVEMVQNCIQQLLAREISHFHLEQRYRHKQGNLIWGLVSVALIHDSQQNPLHFIVQIQDISDAYRQATLRQQAEQKIYFQARLLDAVEQAIMATDLQGNILYWNRFAEVLYGWKADEVLGHPVLEITPASTTQAKAAEILSRLQAGKSWMGEFLVQRRDGTTFPVMVIDSPIYDVQGEFCGIIGVSMDITERKQAEARIQASLQEKEVLLREIHHRVKNNLQVIHSLLRLQSSYTDDPKTLKMFQESQNRIRSMALIHELLYQSQDLASIDFGSYIHTLIKQLARTYTVSTNPIAWEIEVEPYNIQLNLDTALPCGLLVNELVSNALKYAFPQGQVGRIKISLRACNNQEYILVISDNGVGIPSDLDFRNTGSLGLKLVCGTTGQIGGTIELDRTQGTTFTIKFKEVKYKSRS